MSNKRRPTVSWTQVSTASGYKLFWGTHSRVYPYSVNVGNNLSYNMGGLDRNTTYYFAAKAYNRNGDSAFSPEARWAT